jgi:DOPA 4,5-dioxygenase
VFAHPQTGNALKDHTEHVIWLGPSEPLKLSALK